MVVEWDALGRSHSVHCVPWYSGTGRTVGVVVLRVGCLGILPILSIVSHGTMGWDGNPKSYWTSAGNAGQHSYSSDHSGV